MLGCDTLVLLSDIDGLYTANPRQDPNAAFIPEVAEITPEIEAMAGRAPTGFSSGGMITKLVAGKIATGAGCRMAIANGRRRNPLQAVAEGARWNWVLADRESGVWGKNVSDSGDLGGGSTLPK